MNKIILSQGNIYIYFGTEEDRDNTSFSQKDYEVIMDTQIYRVVPKGCKYPIIIASPIVNTTLINQDRINIQRIIKL